MANYDMQVVLNSYAMDKLNEHVEKYFAVSENCYLCALELMSKAPDFNKSKSSGMAYKIMKAFQKWIKDKDFSYLLTPAVKTQALNTVVLQKNKSLINVVCDVFHVTEESYLFKDSIYNLIKEEKFNEAACCVVILNLQDEFNLDDIVIPLILQDKVNIAEEYIRGKSHLQLKLAKFLDELLEDSSKIEALFKRFSYLHGLRKEKFVPKTIAKLLGRILKSYNIPIENCPNLCQGRSFGAMKYLIRRKYIQKNIADSCWDEMIIAAAGENIELQKELIMELICYNDMNCALKWIDHFNLPILDLPQSVQQAYQEKAERDGQFQLHDEKWDERCGPISYLPFRLEVSDIHLIATVEEYMKCIYEISQNYNIVGIDAEWKPSFGIKKSRVALLQLAVWDDIYLLDMLQLNKCLQTEQWNELLEKIFCSSELIKLGYGLHTDFDMLEQSFPSGKEKLKMATNILDMRTFYDQLTSTYPEITNNFENNASLEIKECRGLSDLSKTVLGKPLSKEEQFSDWERRPLRTAQMVYAALDAYCLLQIYEKLYGEACKLGLDFNEIVKSFSLRKEQKKKVKTKRSSKLNKDVPTPVLLKLSDHPPVNIRDFRVVVDTMLQGLGRYLRLCGGDTICLENSDDHTVTAKVALREDRIILTSGAPYKMLKTYVPEGRCFNVSCDLSAKEQAYEVFKHYNVQVTEQDIFSRCTVCNGDSYLPVHNKEMKEMWTKYHQSLLPSYSFENVQEPCDDRKSELYLPSISNLGSNSASANVKIQLFELSSQALERVEEFLVCTRCGKIYWEGSHFHRTKNAMANILTNKNKPLCTVYEKYHQKEHDETKCSTTAEEEIPKTEHLDQVPVDSDNHGDDYDKDYRNMYFLPAGDEDDNYDDSSDLVYNF